MIIWAHPIVHRLAPPRSFNPLGPIHCWGHSEVRMESFMHTAHVGYGLYTHTRGPPLWSSRALVMPSAWHFNYPTVKGSFSKFFFSEQQDKTHSSVPSSGPIFRSPNQMREGGEEDDLMAKYFGMCVHATARFRGCFFLLPSLLAKEKLVFFFLIFDLQDALRLVFSPFISLSFSAKQNNFWSTRPTQVSF